MVAESGIDPALALPAEDSAPVVEQAADPWRAQALQIIEGNDVALRRQQHRNGIASHRPLVIAEERLGGNS